jgi:lipid-binding SYLF domain-containing protein
MDSTAFVLYYQNHFTLAELCLNNQIIPRSVLERASGFAIFTIFKAGFLFSARGGGGIVIARLEDGCKPPFYRPPSEFNRFCS